MKEIKTLINYIKDSNSTVLITGESGTGKEEVAKLIFRESNRNTKPYIALNCAAIPENLLESELFGYEKGAFTNSDPKGKSGIFESVNGGTLFLDEIAELPMDLQAKLLRVLQESEVRRIGGMKNISVDVRIIAATNKNLEKMVQDHTFREDLYYRLNIIPIHIPPLRERKEDIPLLAYHFIQEFNQKYNKNKNITTEAYNELLRLPFNGNVRQLKTLIERIILLCADDNILSRDVRYCYSMTEDQGPVIDTPLDHSWKNQKEREVNELILHYKSEGLSTYFSIVFPAIDYFNMVYARSKSGYLADFSDKLKTAYCSGEPGTPAAGGDGEAVKQIPIIHLLILVVHSSSLIIMVLST